MGSQPQTIQCPRSPSSKRFQYPQKPTVKSNINQLLFLFFLKQLQCTYEVMNLPLIVQFNEKSGI